MTLKLLDAILEINFNFLMLHVGVSLNVNAFIQISSCNDQPMVFSMSGVQLRVEISQLIAVTVSI